MLIVRWNKTKWNVYPATKFAVHSFSELTRHELTVRNEEKIRVSNIAPGVVETEILKKFTDEEGYEQFVKNHKMLKPEDVSANVLHVLSAPYHVNITKLIIRPICEKF
jgi:NADP-dependent 3-hydroxy acid dehydrogenase YdfG